jgi:predicted DNA-binding transcriptional regulator AlpA
MSTPIQRVRTKRAPFAGTAVIWPKGVEARYDISAPTRWRWEKTGRLPPRDVNLGGKTGWRHETLSAAEVSNNEIDS